MRKPIFYTMNGTLLEEHGTTELEPSKFKHKFGYPSDNELWCNYFQHSSQYVEYYSLSSSEPSWDEINLPSTHRINCNNGLGISTNGRGLDVDDDGILPHEPTSNPGGQIATTKAYPTDATPGSTNGINCSNENNGESLSHAPPDGPSPIVGISPNTKGADINGKNGEITDSGMMRNYGECTQLNNNNDNNECEHVQHTQYRRIKTEDISTWVRSSTQLYSTSNNNSHKERTRDEWDYCAPILLIE